MAFPPPKARLLLEDGSVFEGKAFGAYHSTSGEVVFTTGMTGYPQSLTDPSFHGQILVSTYPLVGNYGMPGGDKDEHGLERQYESSRAWLSGLVVAELCEAPSHHGSMGTLHEWLAGQGIPGLSGVDTRALTMKLREKGVMRGRLLVEGSGSEAGAGTASVASVSRAERQVYGTGGWPRVALIDCGVKNNIIRCLVARGAEVECLPWDTELAGVDYDGLVLSNGPGDPKACSRTIASVRRALAGAKPIFGVCLGNQLMALAAGADTYKLPYGHRGQNQPCVEVGTKRCYMTSQNHGYAVRSDSLPPGWEPWFVNGNDETVEGIRSTRGPFSAVQFHPEGCPGPRDSEFLFDRFLDEVRARAAKEGRN